jgi:hypothetical protein
MTPQRSESQSQRSMKACSRVKAAHCRRTAAGVFPPPNSEMGFSGLFRSSPRVLLLRRDFVQAWRRAFGESSLVRSTRRRASTTRLTAQLGVAVCGNHFRKPSINSSTGRVLGRARLCSCLRARSTAHRFRVLSGESSAERSPSAYWMPASKCWSTWGFENTSGPCPRPV